MQLPSKKELPSFPDYTRERHEADPPPGSHEPEPFPTAEGGGIDTVLGGKDSGDEFDMAFGRAQRDGVIDRSTATHFRKEWVKGVERVGSLS